MTWVRTSDDAAEHDKQRAAGTEAFAFWHGGLGHCNKRLTDGRIERRRVADLWRPLEGGVDPERAAARLVEVGLWHEPGHVCDSPVCPANPEVAAHLDPVADAFLVHDFFDFQPSKVEVLAEREQARLRQQKSRARRLREAHGETTSHGVTSTVTNSATDGVTHGVSHTPPVPDPVPVPDLRTYVGHSVTNGVTQDEFEAITGIALTAFQALEFADRTRAEVEAAVVGSNAPKVVNRAGYIIDKLRRAKEAKAKPGSQHEAALAREVRKPPRRAPPPDDEGEDAEEWTDEDERALSSLRTSLGAG